jgi:hypothetical protein
MPLFIRGEQLSGLADSLKMAGKQSPGNLAYNSFLIEEDVAGFKGLRGVSTKSSMHSPAACVNIARYPQKVYLCALNNSKNEQRLFS